MILTVIGVAVAFNVSVYLVLATFLSENKRKASASDFPELKGAVPFAFNPFISLFMYS